MAESYSDDFIITNLSASFGEYTDLDGVPLDQLSSKGAPIYRIGMLGPMNLRGRSQDSGSMVTIG